MNVIIGITMMITIIGGIICYFIWQGNRIKKARTLFDYKLIGLCNDAKTIDECNNALKILKEDCLDGKYFKIPIQYHSTFYELKALLDGKLSILNNKKRK